MPDKYDVDNPEIRALLQKLAKRLGAEIPEGWGFTLFIFEFAPGNSMFYISSAQRQDMLKAIRGFLQRHQ